MEILQAIGAFLATVVWYLPWIIGIYLVFKLFDTIKLLNRSVIDLQRRVKELEKKEEK